MPITALPTPPSTSDPTNFNARGDAFLVALASPFVGEANALETNVNAQAASATSSATAAAASATSASGSATAAAGSATSAASSATAAAASAGTAAGFTATSTTSLTIGTGSQSLTITLGKQFVAGDFVVIADQAAPSTNYMVGSVTSHNNGTGALVVSIPAAGTAGSGTKTAWNVSLSGPQGPTGSSFTGGTLATPINDAPRATVASATTTAIGAAGSNYVQITGTTTITGFDTIASGAERELEFAGALTLTHNATSLILPGAQNITTAAGDVVRFRSEGSGNWRCTGYLPASQAPSSLRAGDIVFGNNFTPAPGYVLADGSTYLQSTYPNGFAALHHTYGAFPAGTATTPTLPSPGSASQLSDVVNTGTALVLLCNDTVDTNSFILTTTDGATFSVPGTAPKYFANPGSAAGPMILAAAGSSLLYALAVGQNTGPKKSTDLGATTWATQTFTSFPTGTDHSNITQMRGNPASGVLMVFGTQNTGASPWAASVNTGTGALTTRTLGAISGATAVGSVSAHSGQRYNRNVANNGAATNAVWVALPLNGTASYWYSTNDGSTWSISTLPGALNSGSTSKVVYINGLFVVTDTGITNVFYTSPDGVNWTTRKGFVRLSARKTYEAALSGAGAVNCNIADITYAPSTGMYYAIPGDANIWASDDLEKWAVVGAGSVSNIFQGVAARLLTGGTLGNGGTGPINYRAYSYDPTTTFAVPDLTARGPSADPSFPYIKVI